MRYEARVTAFDMLDKIHLAAVVMQSDGMTPHDTEEVFTVTTDVAGEGIDHPRPWLRDALIALLEVL